MQPVADNHLELEKKTFSYAARLTFEVYLKDPQTVIAEQLSHTLSEDPCLKQKHGNFCSHPMNSEVGFEAAASVQKLMRRSRDRNVSWETETKGGSRSSVGCVQLFNDSFQTFLKAGLVSFYPLYITLLNYPEKQRRQHILKERTVSVYFPELFWRGMFTNPVKVFLLKVLLGKKKRFTRVEILQALHENVDFALNELVWCAKSGLECTTYDGNNSFLFHVPIKYC